MFNFLKRIIRRNIEKEMQDRYSKLRLIHSHEEAVEIMREIYLR